MEKSNRKYYMDILRIIACYNVIVNHTNIVFTDNLGYANTGTLIVTLIYLTLCKTAVGIFLMLGGYYFYQDMRATRM
jgi:surface polysaccharide O-acyltransferase-like enzyme